PLPELRVQLLARRGIGPWTADYALLRGARAIDAAPARDVALLAAARDLGLAEDFSSMQEALAAAPPWRSYAALHLLHHRAPPPAGSRATPPPAGSRPRPPRPRAATRSCASSTTAPPSPPNAAPSGRTAHDHRSPPQRPGTPPDRHAPGPLRARRRRRGPGRP